MTWLFAPHATRERVVVSPCETSAGKPREMVVIGGATLETGQIASASWVVSGAGIVLCCRSTSAHLGACGLPQQPTGRPTEYQRTTNAPRHRFVGL